MARTRDLVFAELSQLRPPSVLFHTSRIQNLPWILPIKGQSTTTMRGVNGNKTAAAPQHAHVIRTLSAHGSPISPAARRSRDRQPPSGTEVRSGPGGPGGMGRRRRLGSRSRAPSRHRRCRDQPGPRCTRSGAIGDSLASPLSGPYTDLTSQPTQAGRSSDRGCPSARARSHRWQQGGSAGLFWIIHGWVVHGSSRFIQLHCAAALRVGVPCPAACGHAPPLMVASLGKRPLVFLKKSFLNF